MAEIYALVDCRHPELYRYIGKTVKGVTRRLYMHRLKAGRDVNLHKTHWMQKVESEGGEVLAVLLETCCDSVQDLREMHWIAQARQDGHRLTNMSDGGEGGVNPIPEVREKIAAKSRGRKLSVEARGKISVAASMRVGAKNPNFGKHHSDAAKAVMRAKKLGKPQSSEHVAKVSLAMRGKNAKISEADAIEAVATYHKGGVSQEKVAAMYGISQTYLSALLLGKKRTHLFAAGQPC